MPEGRRQVIQQGHRGQQASMQRLALDAEEQHPHAKFLPWLHDENSPTGVDIKEAVSDIEIAREYSGRSPPLLESERPLGDMTAAEPPVNTFEPEELERVREMLGKGLDGSSAFHQELLDRGRNALREMGIEEWPAGEVPENTASLAPVELLGAFDKFVVDKLRVPALGATYSEGLAGTDEALLHQNQHYARRSGLSPESVWPELYQTYRELQAAPGGDRTKGTVRHHPTTVTHNVRLLLKKTFGIDGNHLAEASLANNVDDFSQEDVRAIQLDPRNPVDFSNWLSMGNGKQEDYISDVAKQGDRTAIDQVYTHKLVKDSPARPPTTHEFLRHAAWVAFCHLNATGHQSAPYRPGGEQSNFEPEFVFPDMIDPTVDNKREWIDIKRPCVLCGPDPPPLEPMNVPLLLHFVNTNGLIIPRRQTGTCYKHQRKIKRVVARAVAMGVIDYKNRSFNVHNPFQPKMLEPEEPDFEEYKPEVLERLKKQMADKGAALMGTPHDHEDLEL